jgi:hypothetical protein
MKKFNPATDDYAEWDLERVRELPDDFPNRKAIIELWEEEVAFCKKSKYPIMSVPTRKK